MLSLDDINQEAIKIKRLGIIPCFIIVGNNQWRDLCGWTTSSGGRLIKDPTSKHHVLYGMKIIRLNKIDDYFEIQ